MIGRPETGGLWLAGCPGACVRPGGGGYWSGRPPAWAGCARWPRLSARDSLPSWWFRLWATVVRLAVDDACPW